MYNIINIFCVDESIMNKINHYTNIKQLKIPDTYFYKDKDIRKSQIKNLISGKLPEMLRSFLNGFNDIILNIISSISAALPAIINNVLPVMISGFTNLLTGLVAVLPELLPLIVDGFFVLFMGLIDALNQVIETLMPLYLDKGGF